MIRDQEKYRKANERVWLQNYEQVGKEATEPAISMVDIGQGRQLVWLNYKDIPSTMIPADNWPEELVTDRTAFAFQAQSQSEGKGQHSNQWESPPGNLYITLLAKINPRVATFLSIIGCSAVMRTIGQKMPQVKVSCKWINDVLVENKKVAGVLARCSVHGPKFIAKLGIGINLNADPLESSTCLVKHSHQLINVHEFTQDFIRNLMKALESEQEQLSTYQQRLMLVGQKVKIFDRQFKQVLNAGVFKGINQYGHAIVEQEGKQVTVANGRMREWDYSHDPQFKQPASNQSTASLKSRADYLS